MLTAQLTRRNPQQMPTIAPEQLYKVLDPDEWSALQQFGEFLGNHDDLRDRRIHLLTEDELGVALDDGSTADHVVLTLHTASLGEALSWTAVSGFTLSRPLRSEDVASHGNGRFARRRRRLDNDVDIGKMMGQGWFWMSLGFSSLAFLAALATAASDAFLVAPMLFFGAFITGTLSWTLLWWSAARRLFPSLAELDEHSMKRRTVAAYVIVCVVCVVVVRMW